MQFTYRTTHTGCKDSWLHLGLMKGKDQRLITHFICCDHLTLHCSKYVNGVSRWYEYRFLNRFVIFKGWQPHRHLVPAFEGKPCLLLVGEIYRTHRGAPTFSLSFFLTCRIKISSVVCFFLGWILSVSFWKYFIVHRNKNKPFCVEFVCSSRASVGF